MAGHWFLLYRLWHAVGNHPVRFQFLWDYGCEHPLFLKYLLTRSVFQNDTILRIARCAKECQSVLISLHPAGFIQSL
jgi:hypothetical protein